MNTAPEPPWATGPGEILRHGLELLAVDTDRNRRLAMIAIDNSVELMVKTYLGLPTRITSLKIARKEQEEFGGSFPSLLDALEKYASDKLNGIDLGEIEWYHRLRNQLYHQGNGLTVERRKVEIYGGLANTLFANLFGQPLVVQTSAKLGKFGEFLTAWYVVERGLMAAAALDPQPGRPLKDSAEAIRQLQAAGKLDINEAEELRELRRVRNRVAHGEPESERLLSDDALRAAWNYASRFPGSEPSA